MKKKKAEQTTIAMEAEGNYADLEYDRFLERLQARFLEATARGPLFVATVRDQNALWATYLDEMPSGQRQFHTCHACRDFITKYGAVVTVEDDGTLRSAIWDEDAAPEQYRPSVKRMASTLRSALIDQPFISSDIVWGRPLTTRPITKMWRHLSVAPPLSLVHQSKTKTAFQVTAEKLEEFRMVQEALNAFKLQNIEQAITLLESDALYRSEKVLGPAKFLAQAHAVRAEKHATRRHNLMWKLVATAPSGFCHPRSSMIGTLLEDIAVGSGFDEAARRFKAKMHPLQYQRPQAAPTKGAIEAAERLVEKLGIERSLHRRFARIEDMVALWKPAGEASASKGGVFNHLKIKGEVERQAMHLPTQTMTWIKFWRDVVQEANRVEVLVPFGRASFVTFVAAVHADAPPILQWDTEESRNSVSWYFYHGGSTAPEFNLPVGHYVPLVAITRKPSSWGSVPFDHQGQAIAFLIEGCHDTRNGNVGLFPEILKSDLRGVRSVIEAYSQSANIEGGTDGAVAGLMFDKTSNRWDLKLRVTTNGRTADYEIDRFE